MFVREKPLVRPPGSMDWRPFARLVMMTTLFTAIILGMGEFIRLSGLSIATLASPQAMIVLAGLAGLLAMLCIGVGVWLSVRMGMGPPPEISDPSPGG